MKRRLYRIISLMTVIMMMLSMSVYAKPSPSTRPIDTYKPSTTAATNPVAELTAGQNTNVGDVYIDAIGHNVYKVTYKVDAPNWYLSEVHFEAISDGDIDYIYSNGGLVPGKFTVNKSFALPTVDEHTGNILGRTTVYSFEYTADSKVTITGFAAHAVVNKANVTSTRNYELVGTEPVSDVIVSQPGMTGPTDTAVEVREPFDYPDEYITGEYNSVWDNAFAGNSTFYNLMQANNAEIIWKSPWSSGADKGTNDQTTYGDVFKVDVPFDVPDHLTSATMYIVADNGYIAKVGNSIIKADGFNVANYAAKTTETEAGTTEAELLLSAFPGLRSHDGTNAYFTEDVVPTSAWNGMIANATDITPLLTEGELNTINIAAMNEQMYGGDWYNNPAGVIFMIDYRGTNDVWDWVNHYSISFNNSETAWGMGTDAEGNNWSQIIDEVPTFDCPDPVLINGSFEEPNLTKSWDVFNTGTVPGWTIEWMGWHNSAFSTPNIEYQSQSTLGLAPLTGAGVQYAELDSYGSIKIYQDITTCVNHKYQISFAWSPRGGVDCAMEVLWNGKVVGTYSGNTQGWNTVIIPNLSTNTSGTTRLEFREVGTSDQLGMFLDNVAIAFN